MQFWPENKLQIKWTFQTALLNYTELTQAWRVLMREDKTKKNSQKFCITAAEVKGEKNDSEFRKSWSEEKMEEFCKNN